MEHYRYRKVTPEIKERMKEMRNDGMTYSKIGGIIGVYQSVVIYHLNPEVRKKTIKRTEKYNKKLTKEEKRLRAAKYYPRKKAYYHERYHNDEKFRKGLIFNIIKWQKKNRKRKNGDKNKRQKS